MKSSVLLGLFLFTGSPVLKAQVAISAAVDHPAIDQSRLMQPVPNAAPVPQVDADGNALVETTDTQDDSFGAQMILKDQPPVRSFYLSGGSSVYYTNNVALTRRDALDDVFAVVAAAGTWTRQIRPEVELNAGLQASIFRYDRESQLDFSDLGAGIGLSWAPKNWKGVGIFARYDFTELLDTSGSQILQDHEFSLGAQRVFPLGRAHALTVGVLGSLGVSIPTSAERNQIGLFGGYHLQLTRRIATDVLYRIAGQQYTDSNRLDLNQVASWNLRLKITDWAEGNLYFSYGDNRSNTSVFDYQATSTGGGLGIFVHF